MKRAGWMVVVLSLALAAPGVGCSDSDDSGTGGDGGAAGGAGGQGGAAAGGGTPTGNPNNDYVVGSGDFFARRIPEGSELTLTDPTGRTREIGMDRVIGWQRQALLEGRFFLQLRVFTDVGAMDIRLSFPPDTFSDEEIEAVTTLRSNRLLLEASPSLAFVEAELFFQSSDPPFDGLTNASGSIAFDLDVRGSLPAAGTNFDIVVGINAEIAGADGPYRIEGIVWKEELDSL